MVTAVAHAEATGIIPRGGAAVTFLIASIIVSVIGATIAIAIRRRLFVWMIIGFVGTFVVVSAVRARAYGGRFGSGATGAVVLPSFAGQEAVAV